MDKVDAGGGPAAAEPVSDPACPPGEPLVRLRLDLAYDGSGFSGWASQPGRRTVQTVTEQALHRVLRPPGPRPSPPRLTVAGRTDAGVHARGQVAHTDVPADAWFRAADGALRALAGVLPPDVRLRGLAPAPDGFDARFSALWRRYSYRVSDEPATADPLRRGETLWYPRRLSVDRMNAAAAVLLGEHDFAAFCRRREGATTVRRLLRLDWARDDDGVAVAAVVADAFCHNMVRALIGALLAVGENRLDLDWPRQVLVAAVRDHAVHVVPPYGLCLAEIRYPPSGELASRARATRRVRSVPPA